MVNRAMKPAQPEDAAQGALGLLPHLSGLNGHVLALVPSINRGGGIESYTSSILDDLRLLGCVVDVLTLSSNSNNNASLWGKVTFCLRTFRCTRLSSGEPLTILCFHAGLLPMALACKAVAPPGSSLRLFCYGAEVWAKGWTWRMLLKRANLDVITISDFTSGALAGVHAASIIPPSLASAWRGQLRAARERRSPQPDGPFRVLSVFRLGDFERKGGEVLIQATRLARKAGTEISLTIAGKSADSPAVRRLLTDRPGWLRVVPDPDRRALASLFAETDIFVLATRVASRPRASGEGFGIVLLEAATAGVPVIAPATGGGHAALLDGITGLRPTTDSPRELAHLLEWAACHPVALQRLGQNAMIWSDEQFTRERQLQRVAKLIVRGVLANSSVSWPDPALEIALTRAEPANFRADHALPQDDEPK